MANYLVRVEMHGATGAEYDQLHELMKAGGAVRKIVADNRTSWDLPTATYVCAGNSSASLVRDAVLALARKVRAVPDPWVLVVAFGEAAWSTKPAVT